MDFFEEMEQRIPKGTVRTRFAPSPTGYMHIGNLRTALYTYLIAKHLGGTFILRIEDTDQERFVEGATDIIYKTMKTCRLTHDEGPDVGGPVGPYIQTERRALYGKYAELLIEKGGAYRCFCKPGEGEISETVDGKTIKKHQCQCSALSQTAIAQKRSAGETCVIRQKIPAGGVTSFTDAIYGEITVPNAELDDNVLIKTDGLPTYNFANVIDDHLMGITHVVRGSEYLSSTPKYNLLYSAFGWEIPNYVHCSSVMTIDPASGATRKMSKRHGDPSFEDLIALGYLPEAVLNYVALCGWSPKGEREIYSLPELVEHFDVSGISKSPAVFDLKKLTWMNAEYIKAMSPEAFFAVAAPYLSLVITNPALDLKAIAALCQNRCEVLTDLAERIDFLQAMPDYDNALYVHKKMKTTLENSLSALQAAVPVLDAMTAWDNDSLYAALMQLAADLGVKNGIVLWPIRVAVSGKASTPGGATELCALLGKTESIRRIKLAIEKLQ
ncbi:MAG: glutamate--tRNA ligase [Oscillospiraceae bacterium]|nr:glutamate--tRNA ligase [Oscillospiraceae bacterium]